MAVSAGGCGAGALEVGVLVGDVLGVLVATGGFSPEVLLSGPGATTGNVKYMNAPAAKTRATTATIMNLVFVTMRQLYII